MRESACSARLATQFSSTAFPVPASAGFTSDGVTVFSIFSPGSAVLPHIAWRGAAMHALLLTSALSLCNIHVMVNIDVAGACMVARPLSWITERIASLHGHRSPRESKPGARVAMRCEVGVAAGLSGHVSTRWDAGYKPALPEDVDCANAQAAFGERLVASHDKT